MEVENQPAAPAEAAAPSGEIDVDHLMSEIEAGRDPNAVPAEAKATEPPAWNGEEWAFEVGGKKVVPESREVMKMWLGGGYNYRQKLGELNKTHAERMAEAEAREKAAQETASKYSAYEAVDKYAQENKEWWDHVQQAWKTREMPQGLDPTLAKVLNPLQEKISLLEQHLTTQQQAAQQAQLEAEAKQQDSALEAEIESVQKKYPDIDLDSRDESGETLTVRVCRHAQEIGTNSFRAAFRDLLHDQLVTRNSAQSKLQAVKGTQAQAKAGVLGTTPAPTKGLKPIDPRVPWSDPSLSAAAALEEFRQSNGG